MELLADKVVACIVTENSEWTELELMKMKLGVAFEAVSLLPEAFRKKC